MTLRAVLFDLDGTLAETEKLGHRPAYNWAFKKMGLDFRWGPNLYRKLLQKPGGEERLVHFLEAYQPALGEHAPGAMENPKAWARTVHALKAKYFRTLLREGRMPLRPGVARLIREARVAQVEVAIVTSASRVTVEPFLHYVLGPQLMGEISQIVCGNDVAHKKPAPDLYQLALERLNVSAAECIAIEDSREGLQAAAAIGIPVVITTNDDTAHHSFDQAVLVVTNLGEPSVPVKVLHGRLESDHVNLAALQSLAALAATGSAAAL